MSELRLPVLRLPDGTTIDVGRRRVCHPDGRIESIPEIVPAAVLRSADDLRLLAERTRDAALRFDRRRLDAKWTWWGRLEGEHVCGVAARIVDDPEERVWWLGPPNRHNNLFPLMGSLLADHRREVEQGFMASSRFKAPYFVTRTEAYEIAREAGQLCVPVVHPAPCTLFSEDVW